MWNSSDSSDVCARACVSVVIGVWQTFQLNRLRAFSSNRPPIFLQIQRTICFLFHFVWLLHFAANRRHSHAQNAMTLRNEEIRQTRIAFGAPHFISSIGTELLRIQQSTHLHYESIASIDGMVLTWTFDVNPLGIGATRFRMTFHTLRRTAFSLRTNDAPYSASGKPIDLCSWLLLLFAVCRSVS